MADETKPTEEAAPKYNWEYKQDMGINVKMKEVLRATLKACEAERDALRKKLERLQYGG